MKLFDNYYLPLKLTVNKGSTITWKWPTDIAIDVHDVKLKSGPPGVRKFQSEPASSRLPLQAHAQEARPLQDRLHAARGDDDDDPGPARLMHRIPSGGVAYGRRPWPP